MKKYQVSPVGVIRANEEGIRIELNKEYIPALLSLEGFSHLQVVWWFCQSDSEESRNKLIMPKPYKQAPEFMGVFATRSPNRPNPLALTVVQIDHIDYTNGYIHMGHIDAYDKSPVLDIKPYTPSLDKVEAPTVPEWGSCWPKNLEESARFDWSTVFNF